MKKQIATCLREDMTSHAPLHRHHKLMMGMFGLGNWCFFMPSKHNASQQNYDISLGHPHHTRTLRRASKPNKPRCLQPFKMSTPSDTATPGTDSVRHHATLPTASDTRRQIIANSLVLFPNIVRDHITKFPTIPVRATDIFDVCVANVTRKYGSENEPKFIARLSHAHKEHPAARMLIASSRAMSTMESALHDLLKESVDGLGVALDDMLPVREDDTEGTDKPSTLR